MREARSDKSLLGQLRTDLAQLHGTIGKYTGQLDAVSTTGLTLAEELRAERKRLVVASEALETSLWNIRAELDAHTEQALDRDLGDLRRSMSPRTHETGAW